MLNVIMLSVIMLSVIMLSVMAPSKIEQSHENLKNRAWDLKWFFSPFETAKAVWINFLNGIAKYGHTWDNLEQQ
jgi:hypothetical protein